MKVNCVPTGFSKPCFARTNHSYSKNSCICFSSSDKTGRFEMLWGYVLRNNKGKLKRTNQILLVTDLADVCTSRIILKCHLMCATVPFFFASTHSTLLWILCLFSEFLPCYTYLTFFKLLYGLLATGPSWIKYCTTKYNPLILCFQVENHVCSPAAMLRQDFLCWS